MASFEGNRTTETGNEETNDLRNAPASSRRSLAIVGFLRSACPRISILIFRLSISLVSLHLAGHVQSAERNQARSMVISRYGIVATEHPLASQIGATILAQGGNAVDAAVAANAATGLM